MTDNSVDRFFQAIGRVAEEALQATGTLVDKGKLKVEALSLERRIAKVQQRLGQLCYSLHKANDTNASLVARYVREIDYLQKELDLRNKNLGKTGPITYTQTYDNAQDMDEDAFASEPEAAGADEDAMFRAGSSDDVSTNESDSGSAGQKGSDGKTEVAQKA